MRLFLLIPFACLLLLAACATLSEDACRAGDWSAIGARDGAAGRSPSWIANHSEACADYGIAPDRAEWEAGRQEGLLLYCRPERAWREGAAGRRLNDVCPAGDLRTLYRANDRGLVHHRLERQIDHAEDRIRDIDRLLRDLPPDDPRRGTLVAERARLRLERLTLRTEQRLYTL